MRENLKLQAQEIALVKEKVAENRLKLSLAKAAVEKELNKQLSQSTLRCFSIIIFLYRGKI
ncbi:MAG: hypothetical protein OHK0057_18400 [Thermoflexibacter sp.]